jgi:hypothetical protein
LFAAYFRTSVVVGLMNGDLVAWEGAFLLYQYSVEVVVMDLDG